MSLPSEPAPFPGARRASVAPYPAQDHETGAGLGWIGQAPDLRRIYMAFRRRLRLATTLAVFVLVAVVAATLLMTPKYTATATVMLDPRKVDVSGTVQGVVSSLTTGIPTDTSVVDTEVTVLQSRDLAERVVTALKLDQDQEFNDALKPATLITPVMKALQNLLSPPPAPGTAAASIAAQKAHEKIVDNVLKDLDVKRDGLTYAIDISFDSEEAQKATLIANTWADKYLTEQLETKFQATQQANEWLSSHLTELRGEVQTANAAVEQYKIAHNLLTSGTTTLTEQEISNYNQQEALARTQQAEDEAALKAARAQLAGGSNGGDVGVALDSPVIQQLRSQRAVVSRNVTDMAGKYGPRHPDLLKAQRELDDIDAQINDEIKRVISNLQAKAATSQARTASIQGTIGGAKGSLAANSRASVELAQLESNATAVSTLYQSFLDRFKETSSQPGVGQTDAHVVSRAKIPPKPSFPVLWLNLALGIILAGCAAVGAVIVAELLDTGLTTAEDVERRLDIPHLGSLPLLSSVAEARNTLPPVEYVVEKPLSGFSEAFRALRTSIKYSRVGEQVKTVVLTSALPGEGKTTTAVCLGRSAAQAGDRVVIVDCDLRRRNINKLIGAEAEQGLLEVLNGQAKLQDVLLQDRETGAYVLPLAKSSFTPRDVFGTAAMDRLLQSLREHFDLIILDTAPSLAVADTRVLASKADAVVFLARWRKTPTKAVEAALKQLSGSGAHIAGLALTQVNMVEQGRYGYGDPGYYYAEYKKYYAA